MAHSPVPFGWDLCSYFGLQEVFGCSFRENIHQVLVGPSLSSKSQILWSNAVKSLLLELRFERNQAYSMTNH